MTGKELFRIWAPTGKRWVDWVRPVPFVMMDEYSKIYNTTNTIIQTADYIGECDKNTAVIVDLPGDESVKEGLALAKAGFRPIPVFNGTIEQQGARATVDNQSVGMALMHGARELAELEMDDEAAPAFLLDCNRLHRFKMDVTVFDNSWDVYPQDLPSADYIVSNGIQRVIVVGESVSKDLKKILFEYQKKKITIFLTNRYNEPKKVTIRKPLGGKEN